MPPTSITLNDTEDNVTSDVLIATAKFVTAASPIHATPVVSTPNFVDMQSTVYKMSIATVYTSSTVDLHTAVNTFTTPTTATNMLIDIDSKISSVHITDPLDLHTTTPPPTYNKAVTERHMAAAHQPLADTFTAPSTSRLTNTTTHQSLFMFKPTRNPRTPMRTRTNFQLYQSIAHKLQLVPRQLLKISLQHQHTRATLVPIRLSHATQISNRGIL